jgi:hypothetical protein
MPNLFSTLSARAVESKIHLWLFFYPELTRAKLRSNRAEPSNVTYVRYVKRGTVHAIAKLKIGSNPKKIFAPHLGHA